MTCLSGVSSLFSPSHAFSTSAHAYCPPTSPLSSAFLRPPLHAPPRPLFSPSTIAPSSCHIAPLSSCLFPPCSFVLLLYTWSSFSLSHCIDHANTAHLMLRRLRKMLHLRRPCHLPPSSSPWPCFMPSLSLLRSRHGPRHHARRLWMLLTAPCSEAHAWSDEPSCGRMMRVPTIVHYMS